MAVLEMIENEFQERDFTIPVEQKTEIEIEHLCVEFPDQEGGAPVVALKDEFIKELLDKYSFSKPSINFILFFVIMNQK